MAKIYNLPYKIRCQQIEFLTPHQQAEQHWNYFLSTKLGQIYQSIPWENLSREFRVLRDARGKKSVFDIQGKLALQFLKPYSAMSDEDLMDRIASDYQYQFFCGVYFRPGDEVPGFKVISDIRCELAEKFDKKKQRSLQKAFANYWHPYMENTGVGMSDATAYESNIRYPTSVKILWESCEWIYGQMKRINKAMKGRMPRSKFEEIKSRYLNYQRNRKKTWKKAHKLMGSLLYLLHKLMQQLNEMEEKYSCSLMMGKRYKQRRKAIKTVYAQQKKLYETGEQSKGIIVSIDKDYIRPIVRGKENKRVEFGAKVNMLQVDGINFIEHFSYDAFNEGTRLIQSVWLQRDLFGKCTHFAADKIYANNKNRTYCRENNILTNFIPKGKMPAEYQEQTLQMKSILSRERATRLEGSFGTEKNHYTLHRVKARRKDTEELWIFFSIHTANAARIAPRIALAKQRQEAA
jgi:hypothetical protein